MKANMVPPLNALQIEMLRLFKRNIDPQDISHIKAYIVQYFAKKAMDEADKAWENKGYQPEQESTS